MSDIYTCVPLGRQNALESMSQGGTVTTAAQQTADPGTTSCAGYGQWYSGRATQTVQVCLVITESGIL
jgi:hypothetical protein